MEEVESALTAYLYHDYITLLQAPSQANTIIGPYKVTLQATFPEVWVQPVDTVLQNGGFDYGVCTAAVTYNPWVPSSTGLDTVVDPGNGVWYTTGEDGSLGCASGKPYNMCM
jgi:hypothetical protein